ncbi:MAG TPA: hypothetical protein VHO66_05530 [Ruminiclostridium sp.]|nr:hypothetical protein [Ruminiclostridium sp.]
MNKNTFQRILRKIRRDKRIWFCLICYPLIFILTSWLRSSAVFRYLKNHSPQCFIVMSFVFILAAVCIILDIWYIFTLKAQGGKLAVKEKDNQDDEEETN